MSDYVDLYAVCGLCLRDLIGPIIDQEQKRSGMPLHGSGKWGLAAARAHQNAKTLGVLDVLADEAGLPARRISGILQAERATVGFRIADNLLCALDRPDLVQALDVFARPRGKWFGSAGTHVGCEFAKNGRGAPVETASPSTPGVGLTADGPSPGRDTLKEAA